MGTDKDRFSRETVSDTGRSNPSFGKRFHRNVADLFVAILLQIRLEPTALPRSAAQAVCTTNCRRRGFIGLGALTRDLGQALD
jgi:hypothetical protein